MPVSIKDPLEASDYEFKVRLTNWLWVFLQLHLVTQG